MAGGIDLQHLVRAVEALQHGALFYGSGVCHRGHGDNCTGEGQSCGLCHQGYIQRQRGAGRFTADHDPFRSIAQLQKTLIARKGIIGRGGEGIFRRQTVVS